ncbi:SDR family oxidoreductase [Streptomyces sp. NPDC097727]|uniref:SDR family oxidoreductase n=1 Tax=Streptomyces sp. NPDC097727 TaxID=3366092 RepID=UPI00381FCBBF
MSTTMPVAPLTTQDAEVLVTAARRAADAAGVTVSVTVLDAGGHLLAFRRDDRAVLISGETSTRKAYTAVQLDAPTAGLVDLVKPEGPFHSLPTALDKPLLFIAGGVPAHRDGRLIGSVGVFVSSEAGVQTPTDMVHYGMTKTAQLAVSRGMAQEVAGTGVTVNCVLPWPTMSDGVLAMFDKLYPGLDPGEQERRYLAENRASASLLKRLIRPHEVASMITYVASEQASATTGRALGADGGLVPTIVP